MTDVLIIAVIVLVVGGAIFYLIRAKKRGEKCVGCPYSKQCSSSCKDGCGHTKSGD